MQAIKSQKNPEQQLRELLKSCKRNEFFNNLSFPLSHLNQELRPLENVSPATIFISMNQTPPSKERLLFSYRAVLHTIDSFLEGKYTDFDAHTITNCCHGMSLFVRDVISSNFHLDMRQIRKEGEGRVSDLQVGEVNEHILWLIPQSLILLTQLYILSFIKEMDPQKGIRTSTKKLKTIFPLGTQQINTLVKSLQKHFSNLVANRYSSLLSKNKVINEIPTEFWGQYVQPKHLRIDQRGVLYASNLYSMQVTLSHLIQSESKIAVIHDIQNDEGQITGRNVTLLKGDGKTHFRELTSDEAKTLPFHSHEPILVFAGCSYADSTLQFKPWLKDFASLVLACDVFYPQFPKVTDDPEYDDSPIVPKEDFLREKIAQYSELKGFSVEDPSIFCLTHIYPASIRQILENEHALPLSFIPTEKMPVLTH